MTSEQKNNAVNRPLILMTLLLFGYWTAFQCFCWDTRTVLTVYISTIIDNRCYLKVAVEIEVYFATEGSVSPLTP